MGAELMKRAVAALIMFTALSACSSEEESGDQPIRCASDAEELVRPAGWGTGSHCNGVEPDYDRLFDDTVVHRFDIEIDSALYEATMDNLADILAGGGPGSADGLEDPMWVPVTIRFDDLTWEQVGMRYKGNSSLRSAWQSGIRKLAIRLNFEMYEDANPDLLNQRFFGFQKMTFSNGFKDDSLIRDKVAADIFRAGGVPAARSAFARIFVDYGEGPVYFGLYTMIEDPSDKMLDAQFDDGDGNLYKPEGDAGARWQSFVETDFDKKTNIDDADFSDVVAAIAALNSAGDAASWRAGLEATFDVAAFLRCLAVNQVMVNWDSYGFMPHNYYVYGDPSIGGRLTWFPWDLNEAMLLRNVGGVDSASVMLDEIGSEWPLIRKLLDDAEYRAIYVTELEAALDGGFSVDEVHARMDAAHELIADYVVGSEGEAAPYTFLGSDADFDSSLSGGSNALKPHVEERHAAVSSVLGL
jgi:spore coat protein H